MNSRLRREESSSQDRWVDRRNSRLEEKRYVGGWVKNYMHIAH